MGERPQPTPLVRTPEQQKAAAEAKAARDAQAAADAAKLAAHNASLRTAQIANLLIAGHTFESIGAQIGATADEVESMLNADANRYIRSQPALRQWVRRRASAMYSELLDSVWPIAVDPTHRDHLAYQDRARPLVEKIVRLHGAEAPVQSEVKVDAAPESVQRIVDAIAASQGLGYDVDIFDAEVVDESLTTDLNALEQRAADEADTEQEGDEPL